MKYVLPYLFGAFLLTLISCGGGSSAGQQEETDADSTTTESPAGYENAQLRPQHDCEVSGEILEGNQFWIRAQELLVVIKADSSSFDQDYGPSHRILEVYDTKSCQRLERTELPVDVSPDFPYYIAEITYNNSSQAIAVHGFGNIFLYDVAKRQLSPQLQPQFQAERSGVDAQSGMIHRLEVWEKYLVGFARNYGSFAFNIDSIQKPEPVLPFAEHEVKTQVFHSLFLLQSENGLQAIMPSYNYETDEFSINPAFEKPIALNTDVPESARNNRFLVLRRQDAEKTGLAFDLQNRQLVQLPADMASQKTQAILNWLKGNS